MRLRTQATASKKTHEKSIRLQPINVKTVGRKNRKTNPAKSVVSKISFNETSHIILQVLYHTGLLLLECLKACICHLYHCLAALIKKNRRTIQYQSAKQSFINKTEKKERLKKDQVFSLPFCIKLGLCKPVKHFDLFNKPQQISHTHKNRTRREKKILSLYFLFVYGFWGCSLKQ